MRFYLPALVLFVLLVGLPVLTGRPPNWTLAPLPWFAALAGAAYGTSWRLQDAALHLVTLLTFTVLLCGLRLLGAS